MAYKPVIVGSLENVRLLARNAHRGAVLEMAPRVLIVAPCAAKQIWQFPTRSISHSHCSRQVVTKALQLHPREASLWIHASVWEFEHNRNAGAARALMQRGLRMCPGSADLWAEYFRMELLFAHTLRTRRKILGITSSGVGCSTLP